MMPKEHVLNINIIYEDNHIIVVEKPVNIPSQADNTGDLDMLTILKENIKKRFDKPGNVFLGLVHRLDRPVGGVMVFAKTSKGASRLSDQIRKHEFNKTYLAIAHGDMKEDCGSLVHYLLKDSRTNTVRAVSRNTEGAKEAILEYAVLARTKDFCLIKINLLTGRSHQIRVQFATIGNPLYGDQKYGCKLNKPGQQLALWSNEITLMHPTLREKLTFVSDFPSEFPWNLFK